VKITTHASSSSSISSSLPLSDSDTGDSILSFDSDLTSDCPLPSFLVDMADSQWDALAPDDDDEFCNFIMDAFLV